MRQSLPILDRHLPIPEPRQRPLSAADRVLRARITEWMVHVTCAGIRGPVPSVDDDGKSPSTRRLWQSCVCEDEPVRWRACDVSRVVELCQLCVRGTAGGM